MITFGELYDCVAGLPQEFRDVLVLKLLTEEKISYDTLSSGYIQYIKDLKEKQTKEYDQLTGCITKMYCGNKKDIRKNLDGAMWFLHKHGRVNLRSEEIERLKSTEEE